jgi:ABC-type polysaccharide/polyol phosphate export permease
LLAAPIPRPFLVVANLLAALVASGLQLAALVAFSVLRGATWRASLAGIVWFVGAAVALAVATYGIAETMANRIGEEEEYVNTIPTIGIAPWFFAGSLFSIHALPPWLSFVAKLLPVTHAVALMRYGAGLHAADLHAIWGLANPTIMAALSLGVLMVYASGFTYLAVKVFVHKSLR